MPAGNYRCRFRNEPESNAYRSSADGVRRGHGLP